MKRLARNRAPPCFGVQYSLLSSSPGTREPWHEIFLLTLPRWIYKTDGKDYLELCRNTQREGLFSVQGLVPQGGWPRREDGATLWPKIRPRRWGVETQQPHSTTGLTQRHASASFSRGRESPESQSQSPKCGDWLVKTSLSGGETRLETGGAKVAERPADGSRGL